MIDTDIELLKGIANQLRIHSIEATTAAGSGHPTSCCSAADVGRHACFSARCVMTRRIHTFTTTTVSFYRKATPRRCFTPRGRKMVLFPFLNC
jgi:hypothetical protein